MATLDTGAPRPAFGARWIEWLALLAVCSAYLQGGIDKALAFPSAIGEMQHFGIAPALPFAIATIALELVAPAMILARFHRWLGAVALALFTLAATFVANRFWEMSGAERFAAENGFFEHLGLVGAFALIAWHDLRDERR